MTQPAWISFDHIWSRLKKNIEDEALLKKYVKALRASLKVDANGSEPPSVAGVFDLEQDYGIHKDDLKGYQICIGRLEAYDMLRKHGRNLKSFSSFKNQHKGETFCRTFKVRQVPMVGGAMVFSYAQWLHLAECPGLPMKLPAEIASY